MNYLYLDICKEGWIIEEEELFVYVYLIFGNRWFVIVKVCNKILGVVIFDCIVVSYRLF